MFDSTIRARVLRGLAIVPIAVALAATPVVAHGDGGEGDLGLSIAITDASVARDGSATVSGALECAVDLHDVYLGIEINQPLGRLHSIRGWSSSSVDCTASAGAEFTVTVIPENGRFGASQAFVAGWAEFFECTFDEELGEVCIDDSDSVGPLSLRLHR